METNELPLQEQAPEAANEAVALTWWDALSAEHRENRRRVKEREKARSRALFHLSAYIPKIEAVVKQWNPETLEVSRDLSVDWRGAVLQVYIRGVKRWAQLEPLLEGLDANGISIDAWKTTDVPETFTRHFCAWLSEKDHCDSAYAVELFASLAGDDAECKRIIVGWNEGYVSKPSPIYAFDCGKGPETGIPETPAPDMPF